MKKLIFFLSLSNILFFSNPATAQLWKLKNIETIQSKKLIVLLQEPSPVTVNDLKKKGKTAELEQTLAMYTQFNASLQTLVSSTWTFHQKAEFKTQQEFDALSADEKVYLHEFIKDPRTASQRLKDKTLLILEGDLNPKFTLEELQKTYPYPIKVVKKKDLEAIILSGDPAYAYFLSAPQISSYTSAPTSSNVPSMSSNLGPGRTTISVLHIFMDIQTGDMLAEYQLGSSLFQGPEQSLVLTQKILEKITESFEK